MSAKVLTHPALLKRAFESAGVNAALAHWISAAVPPDADIRAGLRQLRARSRDAAQNNDHMGYFLRLVETHVIGAQGVSVQAKPTGPGGSPDKGAAARIESAYAEQSERGAWDCTCQLDRAAFARLAVRTVAQDGEVLIRIHAPDPESPTGFSVQLIDPEALDIDYSGQASNGNPIRMGVEMTRRRRPVAYWLFEESDALAGGLASYDKARRVRVPASEILHVYLPEWVWGTRGVPWAKTALRRLNMLGGYEEAAIVAARAAASKTSAYVSTGDAPPPSMDAGQFAQEVTPGAIEQVPYGYDIKALDWAWPNTEHGEFVKEALRGIAAGLGVSYNTLANDLEGVNYSSLRHGALTERDLWTGLQSWWITWVEMPLYRRWLQYAIASGRVTRANGMPYPEEQLPNLSRAKFQGRRWPWVDPLKDMQANREAVSLGTRSISSIIREQGEDPEEVWGELSDDLKKLQVLGLTLTDILTPPETPKTVPVADPQQDMTPNGN